MALAMPTTLASSDIYNDEVGSFGTGKQRGYAPGLARYIPMATTPVGRGRYDPTRIAERMMRGKARPHEIQGLSALMRTQEFESEAPLREIRQSALDQYRNRMMGQQTGQVPIPKTVESEDEESEAVPLQDGGKLDAKEDAYLMGEEGPEMAIRRDDGSLFVLPADVTEKIIGGITMENTPDNKDALSAAMERIGMVPRMCGGKMKARKEGGTLMKPYLGGGSIMSRETGRMIPASRSGRRKSALFNAMTKMM